ncbi:MAG: hypothetical protein ACHWZW_20635 [Spirulina sp.]
MTLSTAMSVASFSVVLAETFASVGLSTLVPNAFLALARSAHSASATIPSDDIEAALKSITKSDQQSKVVPPVPVPPDPAEVAIALLGILGKSTSSVDLLVPKSASIDAEFEFYGAERYAADVSVGAMVEVVTVKGGYSALYETHSSNKVKLHVDFVTVAASLT